MGANGQAAKWSQTRPRALGSGATPVASHTGEEHLTPKGRSPVS